MKLVMNEKDDGEHVDESKYIVQRRTKGGVFVENGSGTELTSALSAKLLRKIDCSRMLQFP